MNGTTNNCKSLAAQTTAAINMVTTVIQAWDNRLGKMIDTITEAMKTQALTLRESEDRITNVNGMIRDLTEVLREMSSKSKEYEAQRIKECAELKSEVTRLNGLVAKLVEDVKHEQTISELSLKANERLMGIIAGMNGGGSASSQTVNIHDVGNHTKKNV